MIAGEALGKSAVIETRTPIVYLDWTLQPGAWIEVPVAPELAAYVYVFEGAARVGDVPIGDGQLAALGEGAAVELAVPSDAGKPARLLLLAGAPLREPVAAYGPFVMNTRAEIMQAIADYQAGRMGDIPR